MILMQRGRPRHWMTGLLDPCNHNYLLYLFRATLSLNLYSDAWRECTTVVLRKPGRARYDIAKSYRPIALLNTIPKVLAAIMAESLVQVSLQHELLPRHHFGGLPGRSTTDAIHLIVNKVNGPTRYRILLGSQRGTREDFVLRAFL